jgi:hypothetical protein
MYYLWSTLLLIYMSQLTQGWGDVGHRTVAYLAEKYLTKPGAQLVEDLIAPNDEFDISDAAVWPDKIKFQRPFSRNWHYIGMLRWYLWWIYKLILDRRRGPATRFVCSFL